MNTPFTKAAASARVALRWGQNSSGSHPGAIPTAALLTPLPTGSCSAISRFTPPRGMGGSSDSGGEYQQLIGRPDGRWYDRAAGLCPGRIGPRGPWQDAAGIRRRIGSRRSGRDLERCPLRARPCELLGPSRLGGMVGLLLSVCGHVRRSQRAASMCASVTAAHRTGGSGLAGGGLRQTPRIAQFCLGFWAILMARRSSSSCRGYLDDTTDRSPEPFE